MLLHVHRKNSQYSLSLQKAHTDFLPSTAFPHPPNEGEDFHGAQQARIQLDSFKQVPILYMQVLMGAATRYSGEIWSAPRQSSWSSTSWKMFKLSILNRRRNQNPHPACHGPLLTHPKLVMLQLYLCTSFFLPLKLFFSKMAESTGGESCTQI